MLGTRQKSAADDFVLPRPSHLCKTVPARKNPSFRLKHTAPASIYHNQKLQKIHLFFNNFAKYNKKKEKTVFTPLDFLLYFNQ